MNAELFLPWPDKRLSPNHKLHHMILHRLRKAYRTNCMWSLKEQGVKALNAETVKVDIVFHPPNANRRDRDNCIGAFKSGQDALSAVLGIDDSKFEVTYAPLGAPIMPNGQIAITLEWNERQAAA